MKPRALVPLLLLLLALAASVAVAAADERPEIANPAIDMEGYLRVAAEAAEHRRERRLSEDEFLRWSREPGTIVLDARSKQMYDLLHVRGAVHLAFPDIAIDSVRRVLPDPEARILIYCNNNFAGNELAFASKAPSASLNLSTYVALYNYGYRNVWELGPRIDVAETRLELVSSPAS